ncbi:iron chelate uptake ABC transporter family permease subunit [Breoghania sp.]|uniref:iron chelate uptake ABC transporter family permease subunit n=1 Tax=Breoghania sp. TaxID=2065378 RepID=UPI002620B878|nr:iron chelate uptake ABC transporter family permease subunit [Breoghania sp.]MDJ0930603.1 iron chelate uptake ABC transporter family permease subunit [Breoghania sp.]
MVPLQMRWLEILPLGGTVAKVVGVPLARARLALLATSAAMAAVATLAAGPLSFVSLLAPHLACRIGVTRALPQLAATALIGAAIMVFADWLGRNLYFPFQIPAGLLTSLIGSPALVWMLARRP